MWPSGNTEAGNDWRGVGGILAKYKTSKQETAKQGKLLWRKMGSRIWLLVVLLATSVCARPLFHVSWCHNQTCDNPGLFHLPIFIGSPVQLRFSASSSASETPFTPTTDRSHPSLQSRFSEISTALRTPFTPPKGPLINRPNPPMQVQTSTPWTTIFTTPKEIPMDKPYPSVQFQFSETSTATPIETTSITFDPAFLGFRESVGFSGCDDKHTRDEKGNCVEVFE